MEVEEEEAAVVGCPLEELPLELLRLILVELEDPRDLCRAREASRRFAAASEAQSLWRARAEREFRLGPELLWDAWTWAEFYQRVLHPFRHLLGWWHRNLRFFGGVVRVAVEASGLNAYVMECPLDVSFLSPEMEEPFPPILPPKDFPSQRLPPNYKGSRLLKAGAPPPPSQHLLILPNADWSRDSRHRWRPRLLFSLTHVGRRLRLYCYQSDLGLADEIGHLSCRSAGDDPNYAANSANVHCEDCGADSLLKMPPVSREDGSLVPTFRFQCHGEHSVNMVDYCLPLEHGMRAGRPKDFREVIKHLVDTQVYEVRLVKFRTLLEQRNLGQWNLERLAAAPPMAASIREAAFPAWPQSELPLPGLYFGAYSCHGMEVVDFRFLRSASGRPLLEGRKITGDPNVPVNEISIRVFLDRPLLLSPSELSSLESVKGRVREAEDDETEAVDASSFSFRHQRFAIPPECHKEGCGYEAVACRGRFLGEGQIAGTDFFLPSFTEIVFELLGPGSFGVLWLHLRTHSLYFRAEEQPSVSA